MNEPIPPNHDEFLHDLDARTTRLKQYLASTPSHTPDEADSSGVIPSKWNVISILSPFIGFATATFAALSSPSGGWGWGHVAAFGAVLSGAVVFGLVAAIIALKRDEEREGLSWCALLLNAALALDLFFLVAA